ncbi:MAG: histidine phosphatase family protein [Oscillospiraceae bacterium]|nr:histidine phosphatase family protein [Oscillospiraceae bacterium]
MKTEIYLLRHGESLGNVRQCFLGHTDWDLTELGRRQAACTARLFDEIHLDCIYTSDLQRAVHTAAPIAENKRLPIHTDPGLREINAGFWEGLSFPEIAARYPAEYSLWHHDLGRAAAPGGESVAQMYERIYVTLNRIVRANKGRSILVACHATPIRALMTRFSGLPIEGAAKIPWVSNASVTMLCCEDGAYRIEYADRHDQIGDLATTLPAGI